MLSKTCGGHVLSGENPLCSVIRESKEEIGIILKKEQIREVKQKFFEILNKKKYWIYPFFLKLDLEKKDLKIQKEEIEDIIEVSLNEFENFF